MDTRSEVLSSLPSNPTEATLNFLNRNEARKLRKDQWQNMSPWQKSQGRLRLLKQKLFGQPEPIQPETHPSSNWGAPVPVVINEPRIDQAAENAKRKRWELMDKWADSIFLGSMVAIGAGISYVGVEGVHHTLMNGDINGAIISGLLAIGSGGNTGATAALFVDRIQGKDLY